MPGRARTRSARNPAWPSEELAGGPGADADATCTDPVAR